MTERRPPTDLLLIGGGFFGYAAEIARALTLRGRAVEWFEDRPALDTATKALLRVAPRLIAPRAEAYFDRIIAKMRDKPIRDVLVIKGEALSPSSVDRLRRALPHARFTLYFWDSYQNMPLDSPRKVSLFDKSFTFDPIDARLDNRLSYRPLFFVDDYATLPKTRTDIDLLFVGSVHTDRYTILKRLSRALPPGVHFEKVLYCPSSLVYSTRRVFDPHFWSARRAEFTFQPLSKDNLQALISRARVVLDIERPVQCGYTMRTIEMLGAGKKLLTTNAMVAEADFFDPDNISIFDRQNPIVSSKFLDTPYKPPSSEILSRYSLSNWLNEVLPNR
jgi:hypothetical protein